MPVAILGIEMRELIVFFRADVRDGGEVASAVVGDDFMLADGLDAAL